MSPLHYVTSKGYVCQQTQHLYSFSFAMEESDTTLPCFAFLFAFSIVCASFTYSLPPLRVAHSLQDIYISLCHYYVNSYYSLFVSFVCSMWCVSYIHILYDLSFFLYSIIFDRFRLCIFVYSVSYFSLDCRVFFFAFFLSLHAI